MDEDNSVCDGCGALQPLPDSSGLVTCPSCGRQRRVKPPTLGAPPLGDPADPGRMPAPPMGDGGWPEPPVLAPTPTTDWTIPPGGGPGFSAGGPSAGSPNAGGNAKRNGALAFGCGCLPAVVVLVVLGIIGYVVFQVTDGVQDAGRAIADLTEDDANVMALSGSTTVLGAGDGGTVDVVTVVQDSSSSPAKRYLARLEMGPDGVTQRWRGPQLDDDAYDAEVAQVGDTVFAGIEDELLALDARTGEERWSTTMSDKVTLGCPDCFAAVDGTLVVRTADAVVTGYRGTSGEPRWSRRLTSAQGTTEVVGDVLIITDDEAEEGAGAVSTVDADTGKTLRTVNPICPARENGFPNLAMGTGIDVHAVPGSTDVVSIFGFSDACVVRWDPNTGTIRYAAVVAEAGHIEEEQVLVSGQDLVFGASYEDLFRVDLADGRSSRLATPPDAQTQPGRIVGRTLVGTTVTTRGTPKGGLVAWDLDTGEELWTTTLASGVQPISDDHYRASDTLFDGEARSLLVPAGKGLNLFVFDGDSSTISVQQLDLASGELADGAELPLKSRYDSSMPSITIESVSATRVVFSVDALLQVVDTAGEGEITTFPDVD